MTTATVTVSAAGKLVTGPNLNVVGIDPSLTGTGLAVIRPGGLVATDTITTELRSHSRLTHIVDEIRQTAVTAGRWGPADLVVIEGPSYGNQGTGRQSGHHERAGLWWLITHMLWQSNVPYAVVPPASRCRYATGKGNAAKDQVLAAVIRRFGDVAEVSDNNQADALVLAAMAADHLGQPLVTMPVAHVEALVKVTWPEARS
jgi:crossover junction endodeoxyribonuclease RuvC